MACPRLPFALACLCACGSSSGRGEDVKGEIDGAVRARVVAVRDKRIASAGDPHVGPPPAQAGEPRGACELRVERPKTMTLGLGPACRASPYELVADPEGRRLAYRATSEPPAEWTLVYFGTEGRSFGATRPLPAQPLDWSRIPTLAAALEGMFRAYRSQLVLDEARSASGARGVGELLVRVADLRQDLSTELPCDATKSTPLSAWRAGYERLDADGRAAVASGLRAVFVQETPDAQALSRAALTIDLDAPELLPHIARHLRSGRVLLPEATSIMLRRLAVKERPLAAQIACEVLRDAPPGEALGDGVTAALAVLAAARARCDSLTPERFAAQLPGLCARKVWYCSAPDAEPRVPCEPERLIGAVAAQIEVPYDEAMRAACGGVDDEAYLAAALHAQGRLPEPLRTQVARLGYRVEMPDKPPCGGPGAARAGRPCRLRGQHQLYSRYVCGEQRVPIAAIRGGGDSGATLVFDDRARTAKVVRSAAGPSPGDGSSASGTASPDGG